MNTSAFDPRFKTLKVVDVKDKSEEVFKQLEEEMRKHLNSKDVEMENENEPQKKKPKLG